MFKIGDIVYVKNPDKEYEEEYGERIHNSFFGKVIDVTEYTNGTCVEVEFPKTSCGAMMQWSYDANELAMASELKNMTIEEFSNKFGVCVKAEYL